QEAGQQGKQLRLEAAEGSQARHVLSLMGLWPADHGEGRADGHQ
ncbi:anti-anti-sigma factor, partial [Aeromonas hydrophila]